MITHLLHEKNKTNVITFGVLKTIYKTYFGKDNFKSDVRETDLVINKIFDIANEITGIDAYLEHKIITAIAIRHMAEKFMLDKIKNYTGQLIWIVKKNIITGKVVDFMTPENIHLNSFMYEPILDMDINELLNLYQKVKVL